MQDKHDLERQIQHIDDEMVNATLSGNERVLRQLQVQRQKLEALFEGGINA